MDRIPVLQEVVLGLASAVVFAWITERFGVTRSETLGDPTQA
jgi:hypothetical protein